MHEVQLVFRFDLGYRQMDHNELDVSFEILQNSKYVFIEDLNGDLIVCSRRI